MEDTIEVILQEHGMVSCTRRSHPVVSACVGAVFTGLYGVWSVFAMPGFRKVPWRLKVPYLPSSKDQTLNIMKLLESRNRSFSRSGIRRWESASSAGFHCTGFEINSILVAYARSKAHWKGVPSSQATFVNKDFWKMDLSAYNNVTVFLAPGVMALLGEKLLKELPDDACIISSRFPFPDWPQQSSVGSGLDKTFSYDISSVRSHLRKVDSASVN